MKKILMLLAFAGVASAASAQQAEVTEFEVIQVQDKYQVITNPFWDNWFFSLGGGAEAMFGDRDWAGKFRDRISPTFNVAVGKWFTPGLGLRLQYSGVQARGWAKDQTDAYVKSDKQDNGYFKQKFNYMNLHGDVMFNLNALFGGYNQHRVYEIIPYLGAGFTHNYSKPRVNAFAVNAGIINRFRISNAVDINIEIAGMAAEDKFDGELGGKHGFDGVVSLTAGLTYRFPARGFARPMPQLISEIELANMRRQMNEMAAANMSLQQALADAQQPVEVEETEAVVVEDANIAPRTVFFTIGSSELTPREEMNLSYLAAKMKEFPNTQYTVYGYADSATGTPAFNQTLSQKRAQNVVDLLVKKYGIDASRLKVDAAGGVDKFGKPIYLNRVVLVESAQ
ncbi:OmpA family protein [Bacteroides sp.]